MCNCIEDVTKKLKEKLGDDEYTIFRDVFNPLYRELAKLRRDI